MKRNFADAIAEGGDEGLLGDMNIGTRWLGGFGCAARRSVCVVRCFRWGILFGDLALAVIEPVYPAGANLPLVSE